MKKLIIRDHLGEVVLEADVYLEGQDFTHIEPLPKPIWVKEIYICDPDKLPEFIKAEIPKVVPEPEPEPELEPKQDALEILARDVGVAIGEAISEPVLKGEIRLELDKAKENFEEVYSHESEEASNQGAGDKGLGEAEQPKSLEAVPKKPAKRKAAKRSK